MKDKLHRLWLRRPRLGRRGKIVRNLLLTIPFLVYLWGELGYPLPTHRMNFRRLEREKLEPPAQIVFSGRRLSDGLKLGWPVVVGQGPDRAVVGYAIHGEGAWTELDIFPRSADPTPVPLLVNYLGGAGQITGEGVLLLPHVPEEADRVELVLEGSCEGQTVKVDCELFPVDGGHWVARVPTPVHARRSFWYEGCLYRLSLYDGAGTLLLTRRDTILNKK